MLSRLATITLITLAFISGLSAAASPEKPHDQIFATNTPKPTSFSFVTNTPQHTPTPSVTATETPIPPTPTSTITPTQVGPQTYPDGINSLTGLPYPNEEARNRRNLMVKISNFPPIVRPQSGINQADVVFEYEVEGAVTRFAAIFRSNAPTHIGPVRSGRLVDLQLAPMYNALWAYSGSSQPIMDIVLDGEKTPWGFNIFSPQFGDNCEDSGFCRFPKEGLAFEHTLYLDTNLLWEKATRRGVNLPERARGFAFSEEVPASDLTADEISIDFWGQLNALWTYDEETGRYLRSTDGELHFDANDEQQLWADNLVIMQVPHNERPDLFEQESRSASLDIALWNQEDIFQTALVFRDGNQYEGLWSRPNTDMGTALRLTTRGGEPLRLKPGRTWVTIVRTVTQVTIDGEQ
jgi:hypothetical protein